MSSKYCEINRENPKLAIVVPCYNEEEVLDKTIATLRSVLSDLVSSRKISEESYMLFVDDGSRDQTWNIIVNHSKKFPVVKGIKLSRNRGHQIALIAGMQYAKDRCDCLVTIDADLQDDVDAIKQMVEKYIEGYDVVYGVKWERRADSFFKRFTAEFYYRIMNLFGVNLVFNHADFRLLSSKATRYLLEFKERNVFIRGLVPLVGLKSTSVYYKINERLGGKSKYTLRKMFSLAWDGITSFSILPLRVISIIGFFIFIVSIFMEIWVLVVKLFTDEALPGWASTVLPIYFIGGVQLLALGVVGEYIGKMYYEVKNRPLYFIEEVTWNAKD
ncbi:MAG: glycosyltransferase family 2 protein [Thermodesulforhabdaceae bacterium]